MSSILPRPRALKVYAAALVAIAACKKPLPPVAPGPPIPAEPDIVVGTMAEECGGLLAALDTWKRCRNLDEYGRAAVDAWHEATRIANDAADKSKLDDKAQHAIAVTCRRAIASVRAATERCANGKPPPAGS